MPYGAADAASSCLSRRGTRKKRARHALARKYEYGIGGGAKVEELENGKSAGRGRKT